MGAGNNFLRCTDACGERYGRVRPVCSRPAAHRRCW